jgi:hypothetical protein
MIQTKITKKLENHQLDDGGGRRKGYRKLKLITIILLLTNNITFCSGEKELIISLVEHIGEESTIFYIATLAAVVCRYIYLSALKKNGLNLTELINDNDFIGHLKNVLEGSVTLDQSYLIRDLQQKIKDLPLQNLQQVVDANSMQSWLDFTIPLVNNFFNGDLLNLQFCTYTVILPLMLVVINNFDRDLFNKVWNNPLLSELKLGLRGVASNARGGMIRALFTKNSRLAVKGADHLRKFNRIKNPKKTVAIPFLPLPIQKIVGIKEDTSVWIFEALRYRFVFN